MRTLFNRVAFWILIWMGSFLATNFVVVLVFIQFGIVGSPPPGIAMSEGASLFAFMISIPISLLVVIFSTAFLFVFKRIKNHP